MALRDRVFEALSQRQPSPAVLPIVVPDVLSHDVLRWGYAFDRIHYLLHFRGEVALGWNVKTSVTDGQRDPLPHEAAITAWMSSVTGEELALATPDAPLVYVARKPVFELPFDGFAIAHPTLAEYNISDLTKDLLPNRAYLVFPCHRSEVAKDMDPQWAKTQKAYVGWADLDRAPCSAVRWVRYAKPKAEKSKPKGRRPLRPQDAASVVAKLRPRGDWVDVENWNRRVLRFSDGRVALLDDGTSRAVVGKQDAEQVVLNFLEQDALLPEGAKDQIVAGRLHAQLEAAAFEASNGVEPVFIEERVTGALVARLWVKVAGRVLDVEYEIVDLRLDEALLPELVKGPYLHVLANGYYRGKLDELRLVSRGDARPVVTVPVE